MKLITDKKILIVGLGVIGGGYAKALTRLGFSVDCITKEQRDIDYAIEQGIIPTGSAVVEPERVKGADLIVFALYPHVLLEWLGQYGHLITPGTLVTDVTGVKSSILPSVEALLPEGVDFVPAHPMAGRERSGVEYSDDGVFKGANFIVTPGERSSEEGIETIMSLGRLLGFARVVRLTPEEHDGMIAFLSQLTHVIAVSLMTCCDTEGFEKYTGDSFRDLTRIAKINETMWSELFTLNRDALLPRIDAFRTQLDTMRALIADGDRAGMEEIMRLSTSRRIGFDKPSK